MPTYVPDERSYRSHAEPHSEPSHHVGPCDEACRRGDMAHSHLYRGESGATTRREFLAGYSERFRREGESPAEARAHAYRVYGATVGKVKREQTAAERRRRRLGATGVVAIVVLAVLGAALVGLTPTHGTAPHPLVTPPPVHVRMSGIVASGANYKFVVGWTNPVDAGITTVSWFLAYSTGAGAACNGGGPSGGGSASGNFAGDTVSGAAYVDTMGTAFGSAFITSGHSFAFALRLTDGSGNSAVVCAFLPHYESAFVPNSPTFVAAVGGAESAAVNWTANATQFGSVGLIGANVTVWTNLTCGGVPLENVSVAGGATVSTVVTGLTAGANYSFVVRESNATGFGFNSTCVSAVPTAGGGGFVWVPAFNFEVLAVGLFAFLIVLSLLTAFVVSRRRRSFFFASHDEPDLATRSTGRGRRAPRGVGGDSLMDEMKVSRLGRLRSSVSARMSAVITAGVLLAITGAVLAVIAVFGLIFLPVATFPQVDAEILGVVGLVIAVMGGAIAGLGE